jgi:hypothetical protein
MKAAVQSVAFRRNWLYAPTLTLSSICRGAVLLRPPVGRGARAQQDCAPTIAGKRVFA